ncbi:MAG TPA: penicillin-binding transpeptidase domain-containing protein [Polyangiaceae bacterium]|nr:penicillin-binding transpeptidase domain-containing protein [Polyangiaceae bacterium]
MNRARPVAGALTLVDVATGRVLAAVELGDTSHGSLLVDARSPAASVFKLVTTIALYERTSVTPATRVCTKGGLRSIAAEHLVPGTGDGVVCSSFHQALGTSRNAAYAQLASRYLTPRDLLDTAERLGFNHPLSGQLPGTVGSLSVPEPSLDFARTAAGFENSKLSVFGAAELALAIARGGEHVPLRLYEERADALPLVEPAPRRLFSDRTAQRLRHSMEFTIHSGTAHDSFIDATGQRALGAIQAAGKTGTLRPRGSELTSSWFVGFAPSDKPRVVVSVVLLNSDLWFQKGQQLARDLLRVYFAKAGVPGVTAPWTPGEGSVAQPLATRSREAEGQEQPD